MSRSFQERLHGWRTSFSLLPRHKCLVCGTASNLCLILIKVLISLYLCSQFCERYPLARRSLHVSLYVFLSQSVVPLRVTDPPSLAWHSTSSQHRRPILTHLISSKPDSPLIHVTRSRLVNLVRYCNPRLTPLYHPHLALPPRVVSAISFTRW